MSNQEIAQLFKRIASLLEINGENRFKVLAYRRAAESIQTVSEDLSKLTEKELVDLPGIGQALAEKIIEFSESGKLKFLEKLEKEVPTTLIELLAVQDLGPKKAALFWKLLGITTLGDLESAAKSGKLRQLPGMGEKSEARILAGVQALRSSKQRHPIHEAEKIAVEWKSRLLALKGIQKLEIAGSLRRMRSTIGDLDLVGSAASHEPIMDFFTSQPEVVEVLSRGDLKSSVRLDSGLDIQLWLQPREKFGSLLQFVTGSKDHNVRLREYALKQGFSLSERGFVTKDLKEILCENEEMVYSNLGLQYIPTELREDRGEISAASKNSLPNLITRDEIISDLHMHSTWSEGNNTILEMAKEAASLNLKVICITDHTPAACAHKNCETLSTDDIPKQANVIAQAQEKLGEQVMILKGVEVDILPDGSLEFPDDVLEEFDLVVASIHLSLDQPRNQITKRLLSAIRNPHVDIIGHPSGRELPFSEGADADWEEVFHAAKETGTALEINSNPIHLDLDDVKARHAAELGVLISINSDAHSVKEFGNFKYGIGTARRAWLTAENVINAWTPGKLSQWLNRQ